MSLSKVTKTRHSVIHMAVLIVLCKLKVNPGSMISSFGKLTDRIIFTDFTCPSLPKTWS